MNKKMLIAATAAAAAMVLLGPSTAMGASDDDAPVTWSIEPTDAEGQRDGRTSIRHELDPGEGAQDTVTVTNHSSRAATFRVYAADGVTGSGGNFDIVAPGAESTDSGTWVTVDGERSVELDLDAEESATVELSIAVPDDVTPGDHPAGVVAELVPEDSDQVTLASRIGVRLHLRVAGDIVAGIGIDDLRTTWQPSWNPFAPGTVIIEYTLANAGNVRVGAGSAVSVAGPWGIAASEDVQEVREILPGANTPQRFELEVWPLLLLAGDIGATPHSVGDDVIEGEMAGALEDFRVWAVPWSQVAIVLLVIAAVVLVRAQRRRSKRRVAAQIEAAVAQAKAESAVPAGASSPTPTAATGSSGEASSRSGEETSADR